MVVSKTFITDMIKESFKNKRCRIRLCSHRSVCDRLHEMLIVHGRDCYVRPHKHLSKSESIHVIKGSAQLFFFDSKGKVTGKTDIGEYRTGKPFYCRIPSRRFHALIIRSEVFVFHESTSGPFNKNETVFAAWSPDGGNEAETKKYFVKIVNENVRNKGRSK